MLVCNDTSFSYGCKLVARKPPQAELMLVVCGAFRLTKGVVSAMTKPNEQPFLSGEAYADDDLERVGQVLWPDDFADFKLRGEVLFVGSCHPPKKPATQCPVRLSLGDWKKELMVHGDRTWQGKLSKTPSAPAPFESMPLDWAHAFGGPDIDANPAGKGLADALPNVEFPGELVGSPGDRPRPACMGPIASSWAARNDKRGTNYGAAYQRTRAPFYADDFDWSYFNVAPADQQLKDGYFRGDERLVLQNLHPSEPVVDTRLPALRVRAFAKTQAGDFRALTMVLDTVLVDGDEERVILSWRGHVPVAEHDFDDVAYLLVVSEALGEKPKPEAHYQARLERFIADPSGALAAIPPEMLAAYERLEAQKRGETPPTPELDPNVDPVTAHLQANFGKTLPFPKDAAERAQAALARSATELAAIPEAQRPDMAKMIADGEEARRKQAPPMTVLKPGRLPPVGLRKRMRTIVTEAAKLREEEKRSGSKVPGLDELEKVPHDPQLKELDPDYEPPLEPLSTDAPGPGADLRERDLSDADLKGMDLSGADLREADLSRANLAGANLRGAKLDKAILYQTELGGADVREASLRLANAIAVRAEGADFSGANLSEACFEYARLKGSRFEGAQADYVVFEKADMRGVLADGANFDHSDFSQADLSGARMRRCGFALCLFGESNLRGADLGDGRCEQASFVDADLHSARLTGARAKKAYFMGAKLDGAQLDFGVFIDAHFTKASAVTARFVGSDLQGARLYRSRLDGADMSRSNLMSADLRHASIEAVSFVGANLYDAKLIDVRGSKYDMTGAETARMLTGETP